MNLNKELIQNFLLNEVTVELEERPKTGEKKKFAFNSPFCLDSERKCVVWFPSGLFRCYKSGTEGNFIHFVKLIKNLSSYSEAKFYVLKNYLSDIKSLKNFLSDDFNETKELEDEEILVLPEECEKLSEKKHPEYFSYLINREISNETIKSVNLFINKENKRIVFPIYSNDKSKLLYFTQRSIEKNPKVRWLDSVSKHKSSVTFSVNKDSQIIYLVEGIFDALKVNGGVSILGSYLHSQIEGELKSKNYYKIIVVMDNDLPGLEAQIRIILRLRQKKNVYIWNWENDKIKSFKDFGEIPLSILDELKNSNYYKATESGILKWKLLNIKKFDLEKRIILNRLIKYGY